MEQKKHILVVGLGYRTGLASSNFLAGKGFAVTVCDSKSREELLPVIKNLDQSVNVIAGNQDPSILETAFDEIVLSPGVPQNIPLIQKAKKKGVPVLSEIELAYRYSTSHIVGITGTDGKSTTTMLTAHCLQATGFDAHPCGNIGVPYVSIVDTLKKNSVAVIELSSFQLETIHTFKPDVAILTNLTPDHLDRYNSLDEYFNAKINITKNQNRSDYFIINADDEFIKTHLPPLQSKQYSFSLQKEADCFFKDGAIYCTIHGGKQLIAHANKLKILGLHNVQNAMSAILATLLLGKKLNREIDLRKLEEALYSFEGLPHRVQMVGSFEGRTFINDSKATTVGAVIMALKSIPGDVILILGGRAKGDDYSRLKSFFQGKVKALVLIGETKDEFSVLYNDIPHIKANSMEDAVIKAMEVSSQGDTVLLSPACASFDMYKNYEERGNDFINSYIRLSRGQLRWM